MKKILFMFIACIMLSFSMSFTSHASNELCNKTDTVRLSNEVFYVNTIITEFDSITSDNADMTRSTKTASKTTYFKDSNQNVLWYVTITATFTYDGTTSSCISCSHDAGSNNSHWSIKSCTSSMSGNSATATAVATQTLLFGITHDYTGSVTIYCAPDGTIS
jgi:cell division protein FtsL